MRFCGKTGGSAFINAVRPYTDGKCPEGHVVCSEATGIDNTICVKSGKTDDCPITFMQFIAKEKEGDYQSNEYTVSKVDAEYSFVTSKTTNDSLPLIGFKVEEKPCLNSANTSKSPM